MSNYLGGKSGNKGKPALPNRKYWVIAGSAAFFLLFIGGEYLALNQTQPPTALESAYYWLFDVAGDVAGTQQFEDIPNILKVATALGGLFSVAAGALAGWILYHTIRGFLTWARHYRQQPRQ